MSVEVTRLSSGLAWSPSHAASADRVARRMGRCGSRDEQPDEHGISHLP